MNGARWKAAVLWIGLALAASAADAKGPWVEEIDLQDGWAPVTSEGASLQIARDPDPGGALRLDFDFHGGGGFVIARKQVSLRLPANYLFSFRLRGDAPPNGFEFKLVDPSGANVWWWKQRELAFPASWQPTRIRKPNFAFAWGPLGGGSPSRVGALEIAVSATQGGRGSIWIDAFRLEEREPPDPSPKPPRVTASSSLAGRGPERVLEPDRGTSWHSEAGELQWLLLDFGKLREYGGLVIDWDGDDYAVAYQVESSDDGSNWTSLYTAEEAAGGRDYAYLPDGESRYLRIAMARSHAGRGYAVTRVQVAPLEFSATPNRFVEAIAREAPRGFYPRWLLGEQTYWAVVGADDDEKEALLSVDGMLEVGKQSFSIEPFLFAEGRLVSWADVEARPSLEQGDLPIPTVRWEGAPLGLAVTAFAAGPAGASLLFARYRVENPSSAPRRATLYLAVRPFQVSPPWQSLNMTGGVARIHRLEMRGGALCVNGECPLVPLSPPDGFGASRSEEGPVTRFLAKGELPPDPEEVDPVGFASGALAFTLEIPARGHEDVSIALPFHPRSADDRGPLRTEPSRKAAAALVEPRLAETADAWRVRLSGVAIEVPPAAEPIARAMRSSLAWVLVNRDGPKIQPGSRCYERSWIRDGAITGSALLQLGYSDELRDFLRWYAPFQGADGRVPCCVDARGPDPVPEHDSHGELIWALAEHWRFTRDAAFLRELWPHAAAAAEYIAALRAQRKTGKYAGTPFYGLLPESISHEGYASKAVHSYWDDFFALRGLRDAAVLAVEVGDRARAARFAVERDELRDSLYASIAAVMRQHQMQTLPASVELADFDPNSTAIALAPGGELARLPAGALRATFDRYWTELERRRSGESVPESYTAYEVRSVEAFVRLGQRERALGLLDYLLGAQRPSEWHQWPEITWSDPKAPRFLGDLPHGWIAGSFLRSARALFAYERDDDEALVLGAGVPEAWVREGKGIRVALPTWWGGVRYAMRADGDDRVHVSVGGALALPPGGVRLVSPLDRPLRSAVVNGKASAFEATELVLRELPAEVTLGY